MADSPLLTAEEQRRQQEDQAQTQQATMASMYGGSGAPGYGGMYPNYGASSMMADGPGYAPHVPSGFTSFVSHQHGIGALRTGRYTQGPYRGMEPSEAQEKMHDDYLKLSPEERAGYIGRENDADVTDKAVAGLGGANTFNPGSMNPDNQLSNRGRSGPVHYGISQATGTDFSNINNGGTHQADANMTIGSLEPNRTLANLPNVQQSSGLVSHPDFIGRPMGNPNDTAQYGTRLSGGGSQPMTAWNTPPALQNGGGSGSAPSYVSSYSPGLPSPNFAGTSAPQMTSSFVSPSMPSLPPLSSNWSARAPSYNNAQQAGQFVGALPSAAGQAVGALANRTVQRANAVGQAGAGAANAVAMAPVNAGLGVYSAGMRAANAGAGLVRTATSVAQDFGSGLAQGYSQQPPAYSPIPVPAKAMATVR